MHTHTRWEEAIPFPSTPCVFQSSSTLRTEWLTSPYMCTQRHAFAARIHTQTAKKKKKNVFDVFLWHVVSYDKISLQLAKITASPEWCFEFCCHFNKLIMWLICSSISMRAMHLTPTQWISIFIHSFCGFTSFKCMWEKTCIWTCACTDLTVRLICVGLISYQIALCVCVRACTYLYNTCTAYNLPLCW